MGKITNLYPEPLYRISDSRDPIDFLCITFYWFSDSVNFGVHDVCSNNLDFPVTHLVSLKELFSLSFSP